MSATNLLICPICRLSLFQLDKALKCERGHSYDFAKSGYINLLSPGKMNNAKAGDSKEMIRARSDFFSCGAYGKINDKICDLVCEFEPQVVIDAGSGEGYYTNAVARRASGATVIGFDMSKHGCESASKASRRLGLDSLFCVGNIFELPLHNECADMVINMFAPTAHEEFHRVLKADGHLIVVSAGEHHLEGLKRVLYDEVYLNEADTPSYEGFELVGKENLSYKATIDGQEAIWALFQMTPYYHRTSLADKAKLEVLDTLTTTVEVDFLIYKKI
ncbi:MAG: methyltransferase domain-containing protein [Clostridia bacterium]|nr:methyltransferase domain-containing protein [Clostridia bacterium]